MSYCLALYTPAVKASNLLKLMMLVTTSILFSACDKSASERAFVSKIGAVSLKAEVIKLQTNAIFKGEYPRNTWSPALSTNGAIQVKPYFSGVQIVLQRSGRTQRGVYVVLDSTSPDDGSGISFEKLEEGIYWFEQKMRARIPKQGPVTNAP